MKMVSKTQSIMQLLKRKELRDAGMKKNKNLENFRIKLSNQLIKSYKKSRKIKNKLS